MNKFWSEDEDERLAAWWKSDLSAGEIGKRLNRSRNSVIGRAHRLGLERRPSPIMVRLGSDKATAMMYHEREMQAGRQAAREALAHTR